MSELITPVQSAEDLSPEDIQRYYRCRRSNAIRERVKSYQYHLEMALSTGFQEDQELLHFDAFRDGVHAITSKTQGPTNDAYFPIAYNEARVFDAQSQGFYDRMIGLGLDDDSVQIAHFGMLQILSPLRNGGGRRTRLFELRDSRRAEIEMACLLTRMGETALFPYFSTGREERNGSFSQFNHDFYLLGGDCDIWGKTMVQVKMTAANKTYAPEVLVLCRDELSKVADDVDLKHGGLSSLLVNEEFSRLSFKEKRRLKSMSRFVLDRIQEHQETNLR